MRYTSELTDNQWEIIKPILQEARYRSIEEKREQMNAVFYLVKTGCQWTTYSNRYNGKPALRACPCGQYSRYQGRSIYFWKSLISLSHNCWCSSGSKGGTFKNTFEIYHNIKVNISPRIKNEFEIQPVRWVVERTFGWMTWSRRLSKDYEIKTFYQENICIISNLQTLLHRF